ncbi:fluoride efflux transporter CrcB [Nocardia sp. NBC_00565]|uniref:fluoride efflux transporter CrcB n=1 Tax=Nocardia sp. NBC_00565 TaxID=2975993 RepID=UPI002E80FC23|nr:fluoride efflux transporter CrcB [Nocardia sp. NBC_00565]WUC03456.1 fluoride efflux transporter CrcB [Nocardia sp. NBC_00565]
MNWIMVIIGASIGAPARYLVDRYVQTRLASTFPAGTFTVNLIACALLGLLTGATNVTAVPETFQHLIGPGLCATLSTYSTFTFETLRLTQTGKHLTAATYAAASITTGLVTAYLATILAHALLT